MKETIEQSEQSLLKHLTEGLTGCLSTSSHSGSTLSLYLMSGEIIAAHASDDELRLLQRLLARRVLSADDAERLVQQAGDGPVSELLFDQLDETMLVELTFDRFKENVARFLISKAPSAFEEMEAIFVANLHVSHNTTELLRGIQETIARTAHLSDLSERMLIRASDLTSPTPAERALYDLLTEPWTLDQLVFASPYERFDTLDVINDMLEGGQLTLLPAEEQATTHDIEPELDTSHVPPTTDGVEPSRASGGGLFVFQRVDDAADPRDDAPGGDSAFDDHELSAFGDYDYVRGGEEGSGHFVHTQNSESTTLDRVDLSIVFDAPVAAPVPQASEEQLIEATEADEDGLQASISMNFTGPQMSNSEADRKISVLNEVLVQFAAAFDAHGGRGLGASRIQLLLDGAPSEFSSLFHDLQAKDNGALSARVLLANLRRRPPAEHRRLLDRGILDLIERALTAAFDTLSDDGVESFLESIAGYQQRMRQASGG